jgi:hypothetical protein
MAATAIGGGVSAFGAYQGGQAQKAYYDYQAAIARQQSQIATLKAGRDIMAGEQEAQKYGIQTAQTRGGFLASGGARNVQLAGGATQQVGLSQLAAGQEEQAAARQTAAERAYGEQVEAAAKTASAGALGMAGQQAAIAGDVGAAGTAISTVGSVAGKWYDVSKAFGTPANVNPDSPQGRLTYSSSIYP